MKRFAILLPAVAAGWAWLAPAAIAQARPGKTIAPPPSSAPARTDTTRRPKTRRPAPSLVPLGQPAANAPAAGGAAAPATQAPANAPAQGQSIVTPQAQASGAAPAANAFTAGLSVPLFTGSGAAAAVDYGRTLGQMLDSTIVTLVGVFRGTSGQPITGASGPDVVSGREKDRWARCRNLYWDLTSYKSGIEGAIPSYAGTPALARAAAELDTALAVALDDSAATVQCDNVSSMITAPSRWTPWQDQYEAHARHFYAAWYDQILNVHDRDRAFVVALNATLPAARRIPVPPALQRNPPYAGASVR